MMKLQSSVLYVMLMFVEAQLRKECLKVLVRWSSMCLSAWILMRVKDGLNNKLYPKVFAGIAACKLCKLSKIRHQVVVGDGSIKSSIVIIGEAPGREEDEQGSPFIGRSGKLLRRLMKRAGFDAKPVYIK